MVDELTLELLQAPLALEAAVLRHVLTPALSFAPSVLSPSLSVGHAIFAYPRVPTPYSISNPSEYPETRQPVR